METDLNKLNAALDKRMDEANTHRPSDNDLMLAYRNAIVVRAGVPPRLDDINARFLIEELHDKIADAVAEFDHKRRELL